MKRTVLLSIAALVLSFQASVLASVEAEHEMLRALRRTAAEALNTRNLDLLAPLLHENCVITTVDGKVFTGISDFRAYFEGLFEGPGALIESIQFNPKASALTDFVEPHVGISHGISEDVFRFKSGKTRQMKTYWTATLLNAGGKWKITSLHMSASIFDNPILQKTRKMIFAAAAAAAVSGLTIGIFLGLARKRASS